MFMKITEADSQADDDRKNVNGIRVCGCVSEHKKSSTRKSCRQHVVSCVYNLKQVNCPRSMS